MKETGESRIQEVNKTGEEEKNKQKKAQIK